MNLFSRRPAKIHQQKKIAMHSMTHSRTLKSIPLRSQSQPARRASSRAMTVSSAAHKTRLRMPAAAFLSFFKPIAS